MAGEYTEEQETERELKSELEKWLNELILTIEGYMNEIKNYMARSILPSHNKVISVFLLFYWTAYFLLSKSKRHVHYLLLETRAKLHLPAHCTYKNNNMQEI